VIGRRRRSVLRRNDGGRRRRQPMMMKRREGRVPSCCCCCCCCSVFLVDGLVWGVWAVVAGEMEDRRRSNRSPSRLGKKTVNLG
jgi:hypothetical protein